MHSTITAHYASSSMWQLEFNIEQTDHWYVSWDILHVRHRAGEDYQRYPPDKSVEGDEAILETPDRVTYQLEVA